MYTFPVTHTHTERVHVGCFILIIIALFLTMVGVAGLVGGGMYTAMMLTRTDLANQSRYESNGSLRQDRKEYVGKDNWIELSLPPEAEVKEHQQTIIVSTDNYSVKIVGDYRGKGAALSFIERAKLRARDLADPDGVGPVTLSEAVKIDEFSATTGARAVLLKFLEKSKSAQAVSGPIGVVEGVTQSGKVPPIAVIYFDPKSTEKKEEIIRALLDSALIQRL